MFWASILALLNGALIGLNRAMNARVGLSLGPPAASLWNHLVGFVFLLSLLALTRQLGSLWEVTTVPSYTLWGGVIGASFVALGSFIFPRLGATKTTLLIVAGEMVVGCWIDAAKGNLHSMPAATLGIVFILVGLNSSGRRGDDV